MMLILIFKKKDGYLQKITWMNIEEKELENYSWALLVYYGYVVISVVRVFTMVTRGRNLALCIINCFVIIWGKQKWKI